MKKTIILLVTCLLIAANAYSQGCRVAASESAMVSDLLTLFPNTKLLVTPYTASDKSTSNNVVTFFSWEPGEIDVHGTCYVWDLYDDMDEHANVDDSDSLTFTNGFTIAWASEVIATQKGHIISKSWVDATPHTTSEYKVFIVGKKVNIDIYDTTATESHGSCDTVLVDAVADGWHSFVIVWDGSFATSPCHNVDIYVDGINAPTVEAVEGTMVELHNTDIPVMLWATHATDGALNAPEATYRDSGGVVLISSDQATQSNAKSFNHLMKQYYGF